MRESAAPQLPSISLVAHLDANHLSGVSSACVATRLFEDLRGASIYYIELSLTTTQLSFQDLEIWPNLLEIFVALTSEHICVLALCYDYFLHAPTGLARPAPQI